jgi:isopentenyl phosphate kinase
VITLGHAIGIHTNNLTGKQAKMIINTVRIKRLLMIEEEQTRAITMLGVHGDGSFEDRFGHLYVDKELEIIRKQNPFKRENNTAGTGDADMLNFIKFAKQAAKGAGVSFIDVTAVK